MPRGPFFEEIAARSEDGQDADVLALHHRFKVTKMRHHPKTFQIAGSLGWFVARVGPRASSVLTEALAFMICAMKGCCRDPRPQGLIGRIPIGEVPSRPLRPSSPQPASDDRRTIALIVARLADLSPRSDACHAKTFRSIGGLSASFERCLNPLGNRAPTYQNVFPIAYVRGRSTRHSADMPYPRWVE